MSCCREIAAEEIKMQSCDCFAISSAPNTPIFFAIRRMHLFGCAGSFHRWRGPPSSRRKAWRTKRIPRLPPVRTEKKGIRFCSPTVPRRRSADGVFPCLPQWWRLGKRSAAAMQNPQDIHTVTPGMPAPRRGKCRRYCHPVTERTGTSEHPWP